MRQEPVDQTLAGVAWMERSLQSTIQVPPAMIIVSAIAIYRRASLPRLIAMQRRVLAEMMIKTRLRTVTGDKPSLQTTGSKLYLTGQIDQHLIGNSCDFPSKNCETLSRNVAEFRAVDIGVKFS